MLKACAIQRRQRSNVAIHAEHRFSDDPFEILISATEQLVGAVSVDMRITPMVRAAREYTINERSMVETVVQNQISGAGQRGQRTEIGEIAG